MISLKTTRILPLISLFVLAGIVSRAMGQVTDSHTVTVQVSAITYLQISSGTINLTIDGTNAVAGQDMMSATNTSTNLLWGINSSLKKITVQTSLGGPKFTLKVFAGAPSQGMAAAEVTLSTIPTDFLLNVGRSKGTCVLQYTAVALASQGPGTDAHTITFTVQTQ